MIQHRYIRIAAIMLSVCLLAACWYLAWSYWLLLVPLFSYVLLSAYGSYFIQSGYYIVAYCRANTSEKVVSLTFDDGPHPEYTPAILAILEQHNVKAAFFVIGREAENHPELLRQIDEQGHLVGNHSYGHEFAYSMKSRNALLQDAQQCDEVIRKNILKTPLFYRPPYGVTNPNIQNLVEERKYYCAGWSLRSYDTMAKTPEKLIAKIMHQLKTGDVILLHDRLAVTCQALPAIITAIKQQDYRIERLDNLFRLPAYSSILSTNINE